MIPKSTAPTDSRFASSPLKTRMMMLKNSANGTLAPTIRALRRSLENQQTTEQEIVQDSVGGDGDERAAVVERDQFHAGRKTAVGVDLLDLRPDAFDDIIGVQRAIHDDDRR